MTITPRPRRLLLLGLFPNAWVETSGDRAQPTLYLTFDDGPHPQYTPPLLELLAEHDAKATFFLVGNQVERHPELAKRIAQAGHLLGNHSYSHPAFESLSLRQQVEEIERTDRLLHAIDGRLHHPFRPPRGVLSPAMLLHILWRRRRIGYWSYDSLDYSRRPAPELIELADRHPPRNGDIVLMHDDSDISLDVLRTMLPQWKRDGFRFRAIRPEGNP
ncbi:polysaccharide deacetylase family protein [Luteimonas mephitis]|uniref:polysaccharide deacetylase family protein n=1 Tax=Luteimonas mephitis TaxID=83615 RepID=UPI00040794D6|nr:polysaccharide deacetylase family protein [Luteimonas mephitis]